MSKSTQIIFRLFFHWQANRMWNLGFLYLRLVLAIAIFLGFALNSIRQVENVSDFVKSIVCN